MRSARQSGAVGADGIPSPPSPGRRRLTARELHEQRVAWGKLYGQEMQAIKRAHEKRGE